MKHLPAIIVLFLLTPAPVLLLADDASTNAPAQATATPAAGPSRGSSLESFRIISDRNIFNPNRSGRSPEREFTRREPDRRPRTESFALVGTMSYEKGHFAFFDGSASDYRKVVKPAESIAGFTVTAVSPQQVTLQSTNEADIVLPIGMQLERLEQGRWEMKPRTVSASSPSYSRSSSSSASSGSDSGSDEVLRRLMQQREQDAEGSSTTTEGSPAPEPAASNLPPAGSGNSSEDEILKRLMQKREQENNR